MDFFLKMSNKNNPFFIIVDGIIKGRLKAILKTAR